MNALFTSFVPAPRRIARSAVARWLVFVLSIALVWANGFAAAMPIGESMPSTPASTKTATSHMHCTDLQSATSHAKHAGHGADCACGGSSCACMSACDAFVLAMPVAVVMPAARALPIRVARIAAPSATPPLRPPIA